MLKQPLEIEWVQINALIEFYFRRNPADKNNYNEIERYYVNSTSCNCATCQRTF